VGWWQEHAEEGFSERLVRLVSLSFFFAFAAS
jgi:hypothetical protein